MLFGEERVITTFSLGAPTSKEEDLIDDAFEGTSRSPAKPRLGHRDIRCFLPRGETVTTVGTRRSLQGG